MGRLLSTIQNDVVIQVRRNYYSVAVLIAAFFAVAFALIFEPDQILAIIPPAMLFIVGGTSMFFTGGLVIDEKEKGILKALLVSPLEVGEYLASKIITLTFLATLEVAIMVGGPLAYFHFSEGAALPNIALLLAGIVALNLIYTLLGMAFTVRFRKITDYMIPVALIMIPLQIPAVYFADIFSAPAILAIPSAAPVMIIQGAFLTLSSAEWLYAVLYVAALVLLLTLWARRSFFQHIVLRLDQ